MARGQQYATLPCRLNRRRARSVSMALQQERGDNEPVNLYGGRREAGPHSRAR